MSDDDTLWRSVVPFDWKLSHTYQRCVICGLHSTKTCSICKCAYYCCKKHQTRDWREWHKQHCGKIYKRPPTGMDTGHSTMLRIADGKWCIWSARHRNYYRIQRFPVLDFTPLSTIKTLVTHGYLLTYYPPYSSGYGSVLSLFFNDRHIHHKMTMQWLLTHPDVYSAGQDYHDSLYMRLITRKEIVKFIHILIDYGIYPSEQFCNSVNYRTRSYCRSHVGKIEEATVLFKWALSMNKEWRPRNAHTFPPEKRKIMRTLLLLAKCQL